MSLETKDQEDVEVSKDSGTEEMIEEGGETLKEAEKEEEAKLKAKYPQVCRPGGSSFLQKRLQKGQKYFDSGDYNMSRNQKAAVRVPTGEAIPTPDSMPTRKTSLSKLAT